MNTENSQKTAQNDTQNTPQNGARTEGVSPLCGMGCNCQTLCQPLLKRWLQVMSEGYPNFAKAIEEISREGGKL